MKKVAILVATQFEDTELITTANILLRENIQVDLISVEDFKQVKGQRLAFVNTQQISTVNFTKYDALVLPGGAGHKILLESKKVLSLVREFAQEKKLIAAICAAPKVLLQAQIIDKVKVTAFPSFLPENLNSGKNVEVTKNIITAKDFLATVEFAQAIVNFLQT